MTTKKRSALKRRRYDEPKKMLEERCRELSHEVQNKMREARMVDILR